MSEKLDVGASFAALHMLGRSTKKFLQVFGGTVVTKKVEERVVLSFSKKISKALNTYEVNQTFKIGFR